MSPEKSLQRILEIANHQARRCFNEKEFEKQQEYNKILKEILDKPRANML